MIQEVETNKYVDALEGISCSQWIKIKTAIDRYFALKKRELEGQIQLSKPDTVKELIRSQFGET